jgi:hypothetical protein
MYTYPVSESLGYPECVPGYLEEMKKINDAFLEVMENPDSTEEEKDMACRRYDAARMRAYDKATHR